MVRIRAADCMPLERRIENGICSFRITPSYGQITRSGNARVAVGAENLRAIPLICVTFFLWLLAVYEDIFVRYFCDSDSLCAIAPFLLLSVK